jgi:hypothetical protein
MIQEGLISMCLWGKRVRIMKKARISADMDGERSSKFEEDFIIPE